MISSVTLTTSCRSQICNTTPPPLSLPAYFPLNCIFVFVFRTEDSDRHPSRSRQTNLFFLCFLSFFFLLRVRMHGSTRPSPPHPSSLIYPHDTICLFRRTRGDERWGNSLGEIKNSPPNDSSLHPSFEFFPLLPVAMTRKFRHLVKPIHPPPPSRLIVPFGSIPRRARVVCEEIERFFSLSPSSRKEKPVRRAAREKKIERRNHLLLLFPLPLGL